jgi:hypothetical protein
MLRIAVLAALVALIAPSAAQAAGPASVSLLACAPKDREAEFEARMEQVPGTQRMKLRYTLEGRKPGRRWRRVAAPEVEGWRTAEAATTRFISSREVSKLVGPSWYRTVVRFRWLDAEGATVAQAKVRSKACWQPDHRPNLKVRALTVEGATNYVVLVANTGRTASGAFDLQVTGLASLVVASLEPGEERLVEAPGPQCEPGARLVARADPLDLVDERGERDNSFVTSCP